VLAETMTGHELDYVRHYLATARAEGYFGRGSAVFGSPVVHVTSSTEATVVSCGTDRTYLVDRSGNPAPGRAGDPGPTPTAVHSTMVLDALGVWKESSSTSTEGTCPG
jgi:hypothetical protein